MFRFRLSENMFVVAEPRDDGTWHVEVTDFRRKPVSAEDRREALNAVLEELSSLRGYIYHDELGHPRRTKKS